VCVVVCGDGAVGPGEQCDDGNDDDDDACLSTCMANACGDGVVDPAREACDLGDANASNAACRPDCTLATCGDGEICDDDTCTTGPVGGAEVCDDGEDNAPDRACLPDCAAATCGDGFVHSGAEECDGNVAAGTTCLGLGYETGTPGCRPPADPEQCQIYGCCNYEGGACDDDLDCCGFPTYSCNAFSVCVYGS
jgi:cysteine-rich repeat protein